MIFLPDAWRSRIACAAVLALGLWTAGAAAEESPGSKGPDAEKLRWLTEHAVAVRPAAPPAPAEDFSDLMPLVKSIGSSRVVALGEATHGDGAALVAKGRPGSRPPRRPRRTLPPAPWASTSPALWDGIFT